MKNLRELQGGYPRRMNYLLNMQNELMLVANSMFGKLNNDLVLSGCAVTDNGNGTINIDQGIVFVSGEVVRFDGALAVPIDQTKAFVMGAIAFTDPKTFADGLPKQVYQERKAIIGGYASNSQIMVTTDLYTLATYIRDVAASYALKGEIKEVYDIDGDFLTNFDSTGLGITPKYFNWALDNGNNGTPGSEGMVVASVGVFTDPTSGLQTNFDHGVKQGEVKHKLTVQEMPNHSHGYNKPKDTPNVDNGGANRFGDTPTGAQTSSVGGDQAHNNMQPTINYYRIMKIA